MTIDELDEYGVVRLEESDLRGFLSSQHVGVLGLPAAEAPVMRPLSYWFNGESRLYFRYVLGSNSEKESLSERVDVARFLVFRADTRFNWTSVLLTGTISEATGDERARIEAAAEFRGPDSIERAGRSERTELYRFEVDEGVGIKHHGLPPGFEAGTPETRPD